MRVASSEMKYPVETVKCRQKTANKLFQIRRLRLTSLKLHCQILKSIILDHHSSDEFRQVFPVFFRTQVYRHRLLVDDKLIGQKPVKKRSHFPFSRSTGIRPASGYRKSFAWLPCSSGRD